jgi:hypothetical protein
MSVDSEMLVDPEHYFGQVPFLKAFGQDNWLQWCQGVAEFLSERVIVEYSTSLYLAAEYTLNSHVHRLVPVFPKIAVQDNACRLIDAQL